MQGFAPALAGLLGCVLTAAGTAHGAGPTGQRPATGTVPADFLSASDVFEVSYAADPQISPDGSAVAFARLTADVYSDVWHSNLWIVSTDGSPARPLTRGEHDDGSPRWSPDGRRLAFLSSRDGTTQIYVLRLEDGHLTRLTDLDRPPSRLAWSPDGRRIAFAALEPQPVPPLIELPRPPDGARWADPPRMIDRLVYRTESGSYLERGFLRLYTVDAAGGPARRVSRDDSPHHELAVDPLNLESDAAAAVWTPDGKYLLASANRQDDWELEPLDTEIFEFSLEDRTVRALTDRVGPDASPQVSPDGRWVAYVGYDDRRLGYQLARLHVMRRDGTDSRVLTAGLDRSVYRPRWISDSAGLLFQYHDRGNTKIARVDLAGRVQELTGSVSDGWGTYGGGTFTVARNGRYAFTTSRPDAPVEVGVASVDDPEIQILTALNAALTARKKFGQVEEILFESAKDRRTIQGWLVKPPDFQPGRRYPLILEIHGGPFREYGERFDLEKQIWAALGYLVLYVNQRGSVGYGEVFGNLIHHAYPRDEVGDLEAAVDAVIRRGDADPDNLFVTGGSGGGMLACWLVAHSHRFRAAVAAYPLVNWTSFTLTTDLSAVVAYYWFPGPPWDHPDQYLARSPIWKVGHVKTPTMLIVGDKDYRTPASEAEQFYAALKHRGVDTLLVRFPDEAHFDEYAPSHQIARILLTIGWFHRYRGAGSDDAAVR